MSHLGSSANPLRVAIIGAGPAGFYAAADLLKQPLAIEVDLYDRLPTPFGLVRAGVAPDHQKMKAVTKLYTQTASNPAVHFFGNVELGKHIHVEDLRRHYHQIIYATGAPSDRALGIPGESLSGSHAATDFVGWYNGHPDFREAEFDLSAEKVAVIGVGNVALDVARILCRTREELTGTDIADYALEALSHSSIKEVYVLGRRGPAQVAFTLLELKEMGQMAEAEALADPAEVALDPLSQADLERSGDRTRTRMVEVLNDYANRRPGSKPRQILFRFLVSPVEILGNESGRVQAIKLVKNELYPAADGSLRPRPTAEMETIPVDLVFRSIGYRGVPLPGVPFHEKWGIILNENGRVIDPEAKEHVMGEYATGWIKRGPSGVIGTNKPDAVETVALMMEDFRAGCTLQPEEKDTSFEAVKALVASRQPDWFSFDDWRRLDELEMSRGEAVGRPRLKFTQIEEMIEAVRAG